MNFNIVPFITPALQTDRSGSYIPVLDQNIMGDRGVVFVGLSFASFAFIPTLSSFIAPHLISANLPIIFIATPALLTPAVVAVGIVALGILGYKLDQMLSYNAATDLAVQEYLNKSNISREALDWLIADTGRIKQLLTHENIDLSKKGYGGNSLMCRAAELGNLEVFTLLWENSCDKDKAKVFFKCVNNLQDSFWGEECLKIVDYMVDTKQISAEMFTTEKQCSMQYEPLRGRLNWTEDHLKWLQKLGGLGFSIDVGGVKSIRYEMSEDIFSKALDRAANRLSYNHQNDIFGAMRFLKKNSKNKASALLEGNVWHKDTLEDIAPSLVVTKSALKQAFHDDNVTIGRLLWDMSGSEATKKYSFIKKFAEKNNTKFVTYLLKEGKVSANMFTEEEQSNLLKNICFYSDRVFESLNKLVEFGFDIRAINPKGETVREILIDQIALIIDKKAAVLLTPSLESVDKILEKQNIATAVILKQGQASLENSNLNMLSDDILNYLFYTMIATH